MKNMQPIILLVACVIYCSGTVAVEFSGADMTVDKNNRVCVAPDRDGLTSCITLLVEGEIQKGDAGRLLERFSRLPPDTRIGKIHFNSPGGDLFEAMRLGRLIRSKMIITQVTHDSSCYSACVIAFLGGVMRLPVGPIGIHSFYSEDFIGSTNYAEASERYNEISSEVEDYLKELRIPVSLLDEMKKVPHYNLKIFDGGFSGELGRHGVFGIDPVYAQVKEKK